MANRIERKIYILKNREPRVIEYVQGASAVPILLILMDYDIPEDATARVYVLKPSGKGEYDTATIEDNGVLVDTKTTMFDEMGTNWIQATVSLDGKTLITFSQEVDVSANIVPGEVPESENRSNFLDEYIAKLDVRQVTAESQVKESAELLEKVQAEQATAKEAAEKATTASTAAAKSAEAAAEAGEEQIKAVAAEGSKQVEIVTKAGQTQVQNVRDAVADLAIAPTVTGAQIVARDSAEWPLQALTVYGRSEQATTTGAQLIDFTKCIYQNCTLVDAKTGTIQSNISNGYFCSIFVDYLAEYFLANLGKTVSFQTDNNPTGKYMSIVIHGERTSGSASQESHTQGTRTSITIAEDFTSISRVELRVNRSTATFADTSTLISGLMLYEGSEEKAFEPYTGGKPSPSPDYPQPIVSAGQKLNADGSVTSSGIEAAVTGKNLFGLSGRELREPGGGYGKTELRNNFNGNGYYVGMTRDGYYSSGYVKRYEVGDNSVTLGSTNGGYGIGFDVKATPGETYTVSANESMQKIAISFCTEQGEYLNTIGYGNGKCTATAPDNAYWLVITLPGDGLNQPFTYTNIQLEKGTTATTYEPYRGCQTVTLASNGLPGIQVSSGGNYTDKSGQNWVCDEVNQGYAVQRIGKLILTGQEVYKATSNSEYYKGSSTNMYINPENYKVYSPKETRVFCNKLSYTTDGIWHIPGATGITINANQIHIRLANETIGVADDATETEKATAFKAYIAACYEGGDPFVIYYILDTPIETPLTDTETAQLAALHSYKPTTTITNDAGVGMDVTYVADTKAYIDSKFAELQSSIVTTNAQLI